MDERAPGDGTGSDEGAEPNDGAVPTDGADGTADPFADLDAADVDGDVWAELDEGADVDGDLFDRLAEERTRFTRCYAQNAIVRPPA